MVVKVKSGWKVVSHKGKSLSRVYKVRHKAEDRLHQIEYFKHGGKRGK